VVGYLASLVAWGCFKQVTVHYLIAGHTHFSPDRVFGWLTGQLQGRDIFDMEDVLSQLNHPQLAPRYSGLELSAHDIERWSKFVSPFFPKCRGIRSWHWISLRLEEGDEPEVVLEAKFSSPSGTPDNERRLKVSAFPPMTVESYEPARLPRAVIEALQFASSHIGDRTFRYL